MIPRSSTPGQPVVSPAAGCPSLYRRGGHEPGAHEPGAHEPVGPVQPDRGVPLRDVQPLGDLGGRALLDVAESHDLAERGRQFVDGLREHAPQLGGVASASGNVQSAMASGPGSACRAALRRPPGEELPVELLELADGVGDGEEPRGYAGTVQGPQRQVATPAGRGVKRFARETAAGTSARRLTHLWSRLTGSTAVLAAGPAWLKASVSTPAAGAVTSTATTPAARPGRLRSAASSATSAGRPPDPLGAAAAEAAVRG